MENSIDYLNHKNIVKDLAIYHTNSTEFTEDEKKFEAIYKEAKEYDIKLSNAKDFLSDLSQDEMDTLIGAANSIIIDDLSDEGAYNLLMYDYEMYDFDNDGFTEIGNLRTVMPVPRNMEDDAKEAWVSTMNALDEEDKSVLFVMSLILDSERLKHMIAESMSQMSESQKQYMREHASFDIDKFIEETLSKDYHPKRITFEDIATKVDDLLNPTGGGYSSPEFKESVSNFWTLFQENYIEIKEAKEILITTQKEIEIKEKSQKILDEEKEEPLVAALEVSKRETRTPEEIIAEYRALPGQGGVLDIDAYKEELALKQAKYEPYFKAEYEHYEKYKDVFTPIYSNYTTEKANNIGRDLNAQFPEFGAMREKAYMGGTEQDKEAFQEMFWDYQAYNKFLREKYDMDMSTGGFMAATKESSKAYNYAVYDSLEKGLSIEEATAKAQNLLSSFGGGEAQSFSLMFFSGLPEDIEKATEIPEEKIDYKKQINLTDYGFEHNFWTDAYANTYGNDSIGVKSKIMYDIKLYSFLLENNDVVDRKLDELKVRAYETEQGKDWYDWRNEDGNFNENFKSSFQSKYDNAVYAKEIYDKYADKIFDNSVIDSFDKALEVEEEL